MGACKPMYGFNGQDVENLRAHFRRIKDDCDWDSVADFLLWARESGHKKGAHLRKRQVNEPHGPDNSFWSEISTDENKRRFMENMRNSCEFCKECQKDCPTCGKGCKEWEDWWTKKWNREIHKPQVKPDVPEVREVREVWRYEHPDLVREGIVFEGTDSV